MSNDGNARTGMATSRAADLIVRAIREGRYAPGQRLIEADLVEELDFSRSSVREALRSLEAQGLVEMVPHRGARVRKLSSSEVQELYEVRAAIESGAAWLAALRIEERDSRELLTDSLSAVQQAAESHNLFAYLNSNTSFHDTILSICGNRQFASLIDRVRLQVVRWTLPQYLNSVPDLTNRMMNKSLAEHEAIAERILAGDPEGASRAMREHVEATAEIASGAVTAVAGE